MYNTANLNGTVQVKSMENQDNKKIVVLQVLPELGQGGVELGTIEIASELQKRGIETMSPQKVVAWNIIWNVSKLSILRCRLKLKIYLKCI